MIKILENEIQKRCVSKNYNYIFDKTNGFFARWGKTKEEDPQVAPFPEILDLEISAGNIGTKEEMCKAKCEFCSPAKTLINTPNGPFPIEKIKKGDMVIGYDTNEQSPKINIIQETFTRQYKGDLICFELTNGQVLKLTPEHIVILSNKKEIMAKNIKEKDLEKIIFF